jgi:hypothetical protein
MKGGSVRGAVLLIALAVPALSVSATMSTSDYSVAKERAAKEYEATRAQCSPLAGNPGPYVLPKRELPSARRWPQQKPVTAAPAVHAGTQ